jgi:predicted DNA repair protein MutK
MSGLLALLDDVAAIAKVAAASVDDVAAAAAKAGAKAAGVVIDDAAVTPKYVTGFSPARELPMIWRIARGSVRNKLVFLLPALLLLQSFLPQAITPLLMLGGGYLCFEGAEKVLHIFAPHHEGEDEATHTQKDPAHLEEQQVAGAIKTDFILSAEIMTIALATIEQPSLWLQAVTLAIVGLAITVAVYGAVALIVKMDDIGLHLAEPQRSGPSRLIGRALVHAMPMLLKTLSAVGTVAMLWVGGNIVLHGLEVTHIWAWPFEAIRHLALAAEARLPEALANFRPAISWLVSAFCDGVVGLGLGLLLLPVVGRIIAPLWRRISAAAGRQVL